MTNCIEKKGDIGQIKIEAKPSLVLALPEGRFAWLIEVQLRWQFNPWEAKMIRS